MRKIFIILFALISLPLFAHRYYVKNGGSDVADGLSDGNAWETISKVNGFTFAAGDTVSFKCGSTWRDDLIVPHSGTAGNYMVFNSYSTGDKPQILGSDQAITWTAEGHTNIWQSATSVINPSGTPNSEIFFVETDDSVTWGDRETYTADFANLTTEYDWTWNANVLYVYAASDPDSRYNAIEAPQRVYCFDVDDKEYIKIDGLELAYAVSPIGGQTYPTIELTGYTLSNCHIHHCGEIDDQGYSSSLVYNNMLIEYNEIHDCGRRGISIYNYGTDTMENIIIQHNRFYNGFHTLGTDISTGDVSGTGSLDSIIIRNNWYEGNKTEDKTGRVPAMAFFRTEGTGHMNKIYMYNNILTYSFGDAWLFMGDAGSGGINDLFICNNTFYGFNTPTQFTKYFVTLTGTFGDITLKNNIFYNDSYDADYGEPSAIHLNGIQFSDVDADYNLYWCVDVPTSNVLMIRLETPYTKYYHDDLAVIQGLGWELNSPVVSDPLFINVTSPMEEDSLMIDSLSVAVDAGIGLGFITTYDYRDSLRTVNPDIGAYELGVGTGEPDIPPDPPVVTTTTPTIKNARASTGGGNVTDNGGGTVSARGIVWATHTNPDLTDNHTHNGTGTGAFTSWVGVHAGNDTIHVRSYATNETGTVYGADIEWITPKAIYSDSLAIGTTYVDSLFVRNDSLIFRFNAKEVGIPKY